MRVTGGREVCNLVAQVSNKWTQWKLVLMRLALGLSKKAPQLCLLIRLRTGVTDDWTGLVTH